MAKPKAEASRNSSAALKVEQEPKARRFMLKQSDVPMYAITEALRVPKVLRDEYGKQPTRPFMVAKALSMTPTGSTIRNITGASIAYGLTDGASQSELIALTELGKRAVAPTEEGDDFKALAEAVLKPRVVREFLEKYDTSRVPSRAIALNVIEEMGVPASATERALDMILDNARAVGFLQELKGASYIYLDAGMTSPPPAESDVDPATPTVTEAEDTLVPAPPLVTAVTPPTLPPAPTTAKPNNLATNKRVFISHGKNMAIVAQLKQILTFGGFEPFVTVENETVSKPVPDKVMDDMRSCGAAIVHVNADRTIEDTAGDTHHLINENVLIEIGGALALYQRNFILLVENGVKLPSNLQGLYEVRYNGDTLDYDATMKLLGAFNDIKAQTYTD